MTLALGQRLKQQAQSSALVDRIHSRLGRQSDEESALGHVGDATLHDHVVIVGYGVNGQNVARALQLMGIGFVVVDLEPVHGPEPARCWHPGAVGATHGASQCSRRPAFARHEPLSWPSPTAASTRETVECARRCHPTVPILARTRYIREVEALQELGADEVIPERFETSIELTARVLERYGASPARIMRETAALRQQHYGALRSVENGELLLPALDGLLAESHIEQLEVPARCLGTTLAELEVRRRTGATVLAIQRDGHTTSNPSPQESIVAGDTLIVLASAQQLQAIQELLVDRPPSDAPA